MIIKLGDKRIETPNQVHLCREGERENAVIKIETISTEEKLEIKGAAYVSGMRGDNYPYTFEATEDQNGEDMVRLSVNNSSNPVWWTNRYNDSQKQNDGQLNIRNDSTVCIGDYFQLTVQP